MIVDPKGGKEADLGSGLPAAIPSVAAALGGIVCAVAGGEVLMIGEARRRVETWWRAI